MAIVVVLLFLILVFVIPAHVWSRAGQASNMVLAKLFSSVWPRVLGTVFLVGCVFVFGVYLRMNGPDSADDAPATPYVPATYPVATPTQPTLPTTTYHAATTTAPTPSPTTTAIPTDAHAFPIEVAGFRFGATIHESYEVCGRYSAATLLHIVTFADMPGWACDDHDDTIVTFEAERVRTVTLIRDTGHSLIPSLKATYGPPSDTRRLGRGTTIRWYLHGGVVQVVVDGRREITTYSADRADQ